MFVETKFVVMYWKGFVWGVRVSIFFVGFISLIHGHMELFVERGRPFSFFRGVFMREKE